METTRIKQEIERKLLKVHFTKGILLSFKICLCVSEAEPDQTQTKMDGWAERTGPGGGMGKTPEAERSTQLPAQPTLPTSKCTAGWHIPHPAQRQSREDRACEERGGGEQVTGICWVYGFLSPFYFKYCKFKMAGYWHWHWHWYWEGHMGTSWMGYSWWNIIGSGQTISLLLLMQTWVLFASVPKAVQLLCQGRVCNL